MEQFDLYTKDRLPLNQTMNRGMQTPDGSFRLVVHVCIFNSSGEMLIQQRQSFKKGWPDMWDLSCGGSAVSGEDSRTAAEREVAEELGVVISLKDTRPVLTIHFDEGFDDIYAITKDLQLSELRLQPEEVQAVKWASMEEILSMIDSGEFIQYHKNLIGLLFFMKNHRGTFTREDMD
ncbi:MAG: NUDIX domain-containing protein [Ruminococcus sp.]|nr:NUDIX domain-containing protein [Ruminococcus sp.]